MNQYKSGYICKCPICGYSTYHDFWFAEHVKTVHSSFKIFKGSLQTLVILKLGQTAKNQVAPYYVSRED